MALIPQLNAKGEYVVELPYSLVPATLYQCTGIVKLVTLVAGGIDVFNTYYHPFNLANADFMSDLNADAAIITLTREGTEVSIYIPSTYITRVPTLGSVSYSRLILSADMGPIPDALAIASARESIANHLSDLMGRVPVINVHRVPVHGSVTHRQHELLELNRELSITYRSTPYADVSRLATALSERDARIAVLEEALLALQ